MYSSEACGAQAIADLCGADVSQNNSSRYAIEYGLPRSCSLGSTFHGSTFLILSSTMVLVPSAVSRAAIYSLPRVSRGRATEMARRARRSEISRAHIEFRRCHMPPPIRQKCADFGDSNHALTTQGKRERARARLRLK